MRECFFAAAVSAAALVILQSGCACCGERAREDVIAVRTAEPVIIDGKLDEADWSNAPAYTLVHAAGQFDRDDCDVKAFYSRGVVEPGQVKLLWDDEYLYVGVEFTDSDLQAESDKDQQHHYRTGDVAEVFIKPVDRPWYWEMYVTPRGNKTAFFFPSRGLLGLPSGFPEVIALKKLKTAASVQGTLNDFTDRDVKWTAEMAIPRAEVGEAGEKLSPDVPWLIFFGRYNYSRDLITKENSCFPRQPMLNYHNHAGYGRLRMIEKK